MDKGKRKIINDPVFGFLPITSPLLFDLLEHPWVQRLRRIRQLGLTYLVYPGANHTRFQHSLGASYLMGQAIQSLQGKEIPISGEEALSASIAILLHDIGHGPFSHALEETVIKRLSHEQLSLLFMQQLNHEFDGQLENALQIFRGKYHRKFFNQLISGQLDMDRMDYLQRDSYFTGVSEGIIGLERIIKMLNVQEDELVVEEKGIYSVEKFVLARRLMYWQVYFHKTVVSAEQLLLKILARAHQLAGEGEKLFTTPALHYFLYDLYPEKNVKDLTAGERKELLYHFSLLDDNDIITSAKVWSDFPDPVLSILCNRLINRKLFHVEIQNHPFETEKVNAIRRKMMKDYGFSETETAFFVFTDMISNYAYSPKDQQIKILKKDGSIQDITKVSEIMDQNIISKIEKKHIICYPKEYTDKY